MRDEETDDDPMAPPREPCECWCLHCNRTFMSDQMWFQRIIGDEGGLDGFWMCPTPNCSGAGFTFDIFPTDPDHPANEGWTDFDDDEFDEIPAADKEWNPDEPEYGSIESEEDDLEGEEWKYGLQPGEQPQEPQWAQEARRQQQEEERKYNQPDERPRVIDWSDREDPRPRGRGKSDGDGFSEEDIPF